MAQVKITQRIYVDAKGRPVGEEHKGGKTLAAVPGDLVSEKRAAELGVKADRPSEDKARKPADDKSRNPGENKGK